MEQKPPFTLDDFDALTQDQLCELSTTEIARWTDLACAEAGVKLLSSPPIPPSSAEVTEDQTGYSLSVSLNFVRREDAEAVAALARTFDRLETDYLSGPSFKRKWKPVLPNAAIGVTEERHYSEARASVCAEAILKHEIDKKEYDKQRADFAQVGELRAKIYGRIAATLDSARATRRLQLRLREQFTRYLDLADGNRRTACRFMLAAYPGSDETIPDCFAPDQDGPIPGTRGYFFDQPAASPTAGPDNSSKEF